MMVKLLHEDKRKIFHLDQEKFSTLHIIFERRTVGFGQTGTQGAFKSANLCEISVNLYIGVPWFW